MDKDFTDIANTDEIQANKILSEFTSDIIPKILCKFDKAEDDWVEAPELDKNHVCNVKGEFTVMTYNIWFDAAAKPERTAELFKLIQTYNLHVCCLQEVTPYVLDAIQKDEGFKNGWYLSDVQYFGRRYGVAMLTRVQPHTILEYTMPSCMDRSAYIAEFNINGENVFIGTAHLESLDSRYWRRAQLKIIYEQLKRASTAVFMGDFNFDATRNYSPTDKSPLENNVLKEVLPEFHDVWALLHPNDEGITFDCNSNPNLNPATGERARYDRIIYTSRSQKWKPISMEIIGKQPFLYHGRQVCISDHYGLLASFSTSSSN